MSLFRLDLPLEQDDSQRFLPWIVAFTVFLACLALAGALITAQGAAAWRDKAAGAVTVEIPALAASAASSAATVPAAELDRRTDKALALLKGIPGVAQARIVGEARIQSLLTPWLGPDLKLSDLPLPRLIDVTFTAGSRPDPAQLAQRLAAAGLTATVDDHKLWMAGLLRLADWMQVLGAVLFLLTGAVTAGLVVFATRSGLAVHRSVINLLHQIGATDGYIASQFGRHALVSCLKGGLVGLGLAAPTLWLFGSLASHLDPVAAKGPPLSEADWLALALVPLAAALLAMITARITVMRALSRMP